MRTSSTDLLFDDHDNIELCKVRRSFCGSLTIMLEKTVAPVKVSMI